MKPLSERIKACSLCANVYHPCIPPIENTGAKIMFVARNPGWYEYTENTGPYNHKSASGRLIDKQLSRVGMTRDQIWITNLVLGHTQNNRKPTPTEIANCWQYLQEQIVTIKPKIVATIGIASTMMFLKEYNWKLQHGIPVDIKFEVGDLIVPLTLLPMTHTGQALRGMYDELTHDFDALKKLVDGM